MHLATMVKVIDDSSGCGFLDSITNLQAVNAADVSAMLMAMLDFLKMDQITALFTA